MKMPAARIPPAVLWLHRDIIKRLRTHQPRRGIPLPFLALVVALGILPLLLVGARVLALAGSDWPVLSGVGVWLNQHASLLWVPAADRTAILHVVQLPLAALLVAVTRLSLGIRVLGFRAILIAIGMREIGILPSLLLIAIIAGTVVLVRPIMRRSSMPLYARVSTILSIVAATMVAGILLGTAFDAPVLSSFAFFPVVILAMLAESIAETVARESTAMAAWRTATTILLALLIALISAWPPLRQLTLACPELILTQLVLVILVSEFMDWRLLEDFRPGKTAPKTSNGLHIAVVRNRWSNAILRHTASSAPRRYRLRSVQALVDALRARGHTVAVMEADARLFSRLKDFIPRDALGDAPETLVINCAGGTQGKGRLCQVPTLCEMMGVPYTGPDPLAMAVISDHLLLSQTLAAQGLRTLSCKEPGDAPDHGHAYDRDGLPGPCLVLHRFQTDREPIQARSAPAIARAVKRVRDAGDQPLIAASPAGRRLRVVVIRGENTNSAPQVLAALESQRGKPGHQLAQLDQAQRDALTDVAQRAFAALRCRDLARIELWLTPDGEIGILGVRAIDLLSPRGEAAVSAHAVGISYPALIQRLIDSHITPSPHAPALSRLPLTLFEPARGTS